MQRTRIHLVTLNPTNVDIKGAAKNNILFRPTVAFASIDDARAWVEQLRPFVHNPQSEGIVLLTCHIDDANDIANTINTLLRLGY